MATTYTTNYNLGKQENHADKFDMDVITDNADKIDAALTGLQSSIDGKQAALTTAQLAAVNSGITSTDVEQIGTNKNNISSLRAYGGLKNYATINNGTYTANSGGGTHSITIPLLNPITGDIVISIGNITSNDVDSSTCAFVFGNDVTSQDTVAVSRGDNINVPVSMGTFVATKVQIYPAATYQASGGDTVSWADLMICTKEDWDNSHDYQPYALSNAELTAKEQVNENNILLLQALTGSYRVLISSTPINNTYFGVYNFPRPQSTVPAVTITVGVGTQGGGVVDPEKFSSNVYEWGFRVYTTESAYAGLIVTVTLS